MPSKPQRNFQALEQRRLRAERLLRGGVCQSEVARRLGVSRQSVSRWAKQIKSSGPRGLRTAGPAGRKPLLSANCKKVIESKLKRGPQALGHATGGWTLRQLAGLIEREAGIRYHPSQVSRIMRQMGWRREMPPRFVNDKPRLWGRLSRKFRDLRTDKIAAMMLQYENKPVKSWRTKDWGLLDVLYEILCGRFTRQKSLTHDDPLGTTTPEFRKLLYKRLAFYMNATYRSST